MKPRNPGRKRTGITHPLAVTFRTDDKGFNLIERRARKHKMGHGEYLRFAVEQEAGK